MKSKFIVLILSVAVLAVVLIMAGCAAKNSSESGNTKVSDKVTEVSVDGNTSDALNAQDNSSSDGTGNVNKAGDANASASDALGVSNATGTNDATNADGADGTTGLIAEDEEPEEKFVVVFDPGHGGKFGGAYYFSTDEKTLTLKVANYARDYLLSNYSNVEVYLTREEDIALDSDIKVELEMRCEYAKQVNADCLVSIHFNACDSHNMSGSEVWCSRRENVKEQTASLGNAIMDELEAIGLKRRQVGTRKSNDMFDEQGVAYDYYAINRHCANRDIPGIIVEQCFMDNEYDQQYVKTEEGLKMLGEANAKGVAKYLGLEPIG